ncbi:MAG: YheU family protein [Desulfobacterales bacterium]|nr:YheU family protein [Desulfobacterales bacterium]
MSFVIIPYDRLSPETLYGVVEEFVTRDGTDYGEREVTLEVKISQIINQLKSNEAVIAFDQESQSCNIVKSDDPSLPELR